MSRRSLVLSTLVAAALIVTSAMPARAAADPGDFTATPLAPSSPPSEGAKTPSGRLAQSDPAILARTDAATVPIMVKIDVDPVASYTGGVDGFAATSPEITGVGISRGDPAVDAYRAYAESALADAAAEITAAVPSAQVTRTYAVAYGGLAVTIPASEAKAVRAVDGVAAVQDDALHKISATQSDAAAVTGSAAPDVSSSAGDDASDHEDGSVIGADAVWPSLGGGDLAGRGVIIGVIDSGIWPEHPMLADNGIDAPAGGPWACDFGDGGDAAFTCNDKLVGASAFLDTYRANHRIGVDDFCSETTCSARDSDGHGTQAATIAAGDDVGPAQTTDPDRAPSSGIAPGASVIAYRAVGPEGAYDSDLVAAAQQAIEDGVDVIISAVNGSRSAYSDPVELGFLDAYAAGTSVTAAPEESEQEPSTDGHSAPWVTTIGASAAVSAGVSALLKAAHPAWTPGQIRSALMTSSVPPADAGGTQAGGSEREAGGIRAERAVNPTLTLSDTAEAFWARAGDPVSRLDLNIPSVYIDPLPGAATVTRTVTNVTDRPQVLVAKGTADEGIELDVLPASFALEPGKSQVIRIIVDGLEAAHGWHQGQITITSTRQGAVPVVLPVTVNAADAQIALSQSCTPAVVTTDATTTCTVAASSFLPVDIDARIETVATQSLQATSASPPATQTLQGSTWTGTLTAAVAPMIESLAEGVGPGGGYVPLSAFDIPPIAGFGDESIASFTVPLFRYGGETYDSIAVDSDGYIVVGGGSVPESVAHGNGLPDTDVPNNVLAPLWTDLDPAAGGAVRVGVLGDGTTEWLVVDWSEVPTFAGAGTNTFEAWIQLGATEGQWFSYAAAAVVDPGTPAVVGAENRDGTSGVEAPLPAAATEYSVVTAAETPSSTVIFDYTLTGRDTGSWSTLATLRSSALGSISTATATITVK